MTGSSSCFFWVGLLTLPWFFLMVTLHVQIIPHLFSRCYCKSFFGNFLQCGQMCEPECLKEKKFICNVKFLHSCVSNHFWFMDRRSMKIFCAFPTVTMITRIDLPYDIFLHRSTLLFGFQCVFVFDAESIKLRSCHLESVGTTSQDWWKTSFQNA